VDFTVDWSQRTELPIRSFLGWMALSPAKFYRWQQRYGQANEHNGKIPRDFWLEEWERQAILDFHDLHPLEGYRRLTFMMLDQDIVAVSPSSVYRVLRADGRLDRWNGKPSGKGKGFGQPDAAHLHWHSDIAYVNVGGTPCVIFGPGDVRVAHSADEHVSLDQVEDCARILAAWVRRELTPGSQPSLGRSARLRGLHRAPARQQHPGREDDQRRADEPERGVARGRDDEPGAKAGRRG